MSYRGPARRAGLLRGKGGQPGWSGASPPGPLSVCGPAGGSGARASTVPVWTGLEVPNSSVSQSLRGVGQVATLSPRTGLSAWGFCSPWSRALTPARVASVAEGPDAPAHRSRPSRGGGRQDNGAAAARHHGRGRQGGRPGRRVQAEQGSPCCRAGAGASGPRGRLRPRRSLYCPCSERGRPLLRAPQSRPPAPARAGSRVPEPRQGAATPTLSGAGGRCALAFERVSRDGARPCAWGGGLPLLLPCGTTSCVSLHPPRSLARPGRAGAKCPGA